MAIKGISFIALMRPTRHGITTILSRRSLSSGIAMSVPMKMAVVAGITSFRLERLRLIIALLATFAGRGLILRGFLSSARIAIRRIRHFKRLMPNVIAKAKVSTN